VATPLVISFVSGKGGVGKTSLASNFAWVCGRMRKTLLIDLDFQNQGASGLFLRYLPADAGGALDVLTSAADFSSCQPATVADNVFFIPAVTLSRTTEYSKVAGLMRDSALGDRLRAFLSHLASACGAEIFILDCHGGLDYVSVAAYELSDHTIVVTEADTVTFNGTLELLDFYRAQLSSPARAAVAAAAGAEGIAPAGEPCGSRRYGEVSFVVNRLPNKYRFKDLDGVYTRLIADHESAFPLRSSVLSFIPEEGFLADSFGEYPFCVVLAPKSVVARKTHLMAWDLLDPDSQEVAGYKPLRKLQSEKVRRKIQALTVSAEQRNTSNIIFAFGWLWIVFTVVVGALFSLGFTAAISGKDSTDPATLERSHVFMAVFFLSLLTCTYYSIRAQVGLMLFYNEKYKFRRALHRATGVPLTFWQRLALARFWFLRLGTAIGPALMALMALIYLVLAIIGLAQGRLGS
jgi:MinD-like ATPase involved in chromosome partitioning or flagellar assembly